LRRSISIIFFTKCRLLYGVIVNICCRFVIFSTADFKVGSLHYWQLSRASIRVGDTCTRNTNQDYKLAYRRRACFIAMQWLMTDC